MTNALLFAIACILGVGFVAVLTVLVEIRDAVYDARVELQRLSDALEDDELLDEWSIVAGNPPFGYGSGKGKPPL